MKKTKKILKYWFPPLVWATVIFWFSTLPLTETSKIYWQDFLIKKTAHMIEYGIFSLLLFRALINYGVVRKKAIFLTLVIAILYAITDEIHQAFVPGREPRVRDVVFDTIGATLGVLIWEKF